MFDIYAREFIRITRNNTTIYDNNNKPEKNNRYNLYKGYCKGNCITNICVKCQPNN